MKKLILLLALLVTGCVSVQYPCDKILQVDYTENNEIKHLFLNVEQLDESTYRVRSQEWYCDSTSFVILNIFEYEKY